MIDVTQQVNAVSRKVGTRVIAAGEARTTTMSQTYNAGIDDVWDACTNAERIPRWFLPISGDLRLHGTYQFEGNAGGTIEHCDPPNAFAATWEYDGTVSWIEVRLSAESPERTTFELEHIAIENDHWVEFGPGAAGVGWDGAFMGLALHLPTGEAIDPAAAEAWMTSPDAIRFNQLSGERWYEADVASGTDPELARARADRVIAAYTGADEPAAPQDTSA